MPLRPPARCGGLFHYNSRWGENHFFTQNSRRWGPPVRHDAMMRPSSACKAGPLDETLRPASEKQYALSKFSSALHDELVSTLSTIRSSSDGPSTTGGSSPHPAANAQRDVAIKTKNSFLIPKPSPRAIPQPPNRRLLTSKRGNCSYPLGLKSGALA